MIVMNCRDNHSHHKHRIRNGIWTQNQVILHAVHHTSIKLACYPSLCKLNLLCLLNLSIVIKNFIFVARENLSNCIQSSVLTTLIWCQHNCVSSVNFCGFFRAPFVLTAQQLTLHCVMTKLFTLIFDTILCLACL